MLKSAIKVIVTIVVCNVAAYNIRFPENQEVYNYHKLRDHHSSHNYPRSIPEFVDNDRQTDNNFNGNYYEWLIENLLNSKGWLDSQEMKLSTISAAQSIAQSQPEFRTQCIRSCPTTTEYNPVCGTNYRMYDNIGKLECARYCGVDVTLLRKSRCPKLPLENLSTPSPTTSTGVPPELSFDVRIKDVK